MFKKRNLLIALFCWISCSIATTVLAKGLPELPLHSSYKEHFLFESHISRVPLILPKKFPGSEKISKESKFYEEALEKLNEAIYDEAVFLAHRESARPKNNPEPWYALIAETYYRRGRDARLESYLAQRIYEVQNLVIARHLWLRYGDSLFWQRKYPEAVLWYKQRDELFKKSKTQAVRYSHLYYAEALYQMGQIEKAHEEYKKIERSFRGKEKSARLTDWLHYRKWITHKAKNQKKHLDRLRNIITAFKSTKTALVPIAKLTWARGIIQAGLDKKYEDAHDILQEIIKAEIPEKLKKEAQVLQGIIAWVSNDTTLAWQTWQPLINRPLSRKDPLALAFSEQIVTMLLKEERSLDFLLHAHQARFLIEIAPNRISILPIIAQTAVEHGLDAAGARLFQRLLAQFYLSTTEKEGIILKLAQTYLKLGEQERAEKLMEEIIEVPAHPAVRKNYHLTHAILAKTQQRFATCAQNLKELLKYPMTGQQLFHYAVEGSYCARHDNQVGQAEKFLNLLGPAADLISSKTKKPTALPRWQRAALFEKINLLATNTQYKEAVDLFELMVEHMTEDLMKKPPPLEALFSIINSYRHINKTERALRVWENHAPHYEAFPEGFRKEYASLLTLFAQTELLPTAH